MIFRSKTSRILLCTVLTLVLLPLSAFCRSDRFVDSDDYKKKEFKPGILAEYSDLEKARNVEWAWVAKDVKLSDSKIEISSFDDASDELGKGQINSVKAILRDSLERSKGKQTLTVEASAYEYQKFSPGKAWIPYAGGSLMQAGIGVELLFKDKSGKTVAKIRHFARSGSMVENAAQEFSDDVRKFINKN